MHNKMTYIVVQFQEQLQPDLRNGTRVNGKAEQEITFHQSFFIGFRNSVGNVE